MDDGARELLLAMREIIKHAILTLHALRDPDQRFLGWGRMPAYVVANALVVVSIG